MKLVVVRTIPAQFDFSRNCMRLIKASTPKHLRNHFRPAAGLNFKFRGWYDSSDLTLGVVEWHGSDRDLLYLKLQDTTNTIYSAHDLSDTALAAYTKLKYLYGKHKIRLLHVDNNADRVKYNQAFDIVIGDMKVK